MGDANQQAADLLAKAAVMRRAFTAAFVHRCQSCGQFCGPS
jgi:hypothetical protein